MGYIALAAMLLAAALVRVVAPGGWKVVDGDTLQRKGRRYRLQGYDAPEWDQPHGNDARRALSGMLSANWSLAVTVGIDKYGRRLVWMATRRGPIASRMILSGNGHAEGIGGAFLQIGARITGRGLWRTRGAVHPRAWRQSHPRPNRLPRRARPS